MKLSEFLKELRETVQYYPDLAAITGSHTAAVFLGQLAYWTGYQKSEEGWIYKTQEEWQLETELSSKEQAAARAVLRRMDVIEERYVGVPRRLEYRLLEDNLNELWTDWFPCVQAKRRLKELLKENATLLKYGTVASPIMQEIEALREQLKQARSDKFKNPKTLVKSIFDQREIKESPNGGSKRVPKGKTNGDQRAKQGSTSGEDYLYIQEITSKDYLQETTATANKDATLDAAAVARKKEGNEFEGIKDNQGQVVADTPHIVNSQKSVTTEKSNQVDQKSAPAAREVVMTSHLEMANNYLKSVGIRGNKTLNKLISTKSIDEIVMAIGFVFEKEVDFYRDGKEPIQNKAGFFKRALEDNSAIDWLEMMGYTLEQKELWKWATEARIRGIFDRIDMGSNNAWIKDGFCTYKIDATKELCDQWGWEALRNELIKYDRKRRQESQQQSA